MTIIVKIVLLGDGSVGKTTLRERFMGRGFTTSYLPTLGAEFVSKVLPITRPTKTISLRFQIWDLAGQPTFKQIRKLYYRDSVGLILVFDITRPESLYNLKTWLSEAITYSGSKKLSVVILGNKIDLRELDWVRAEEITQTLNEINKFDTLDSPAIFYQTSAKTGENVNLAFETIGKKILDRYEQLNYFDEV
ncbi:Rab family GTPase [Candidatus Hodarchaeum mangrovi]